jgi:hypothetical protein
MLRWQCILRSYPNVGIALFILFIFTNTTYVPKWDSGPPGAPAAISEYSILNSQQQIYTSYWMNGHMLELSLLDHPRFDLQA